MYIYIHIYIYNIYTYIYIYIYIIGRTEKLWEDDFLKNLGKLGKNNEGSSLVIKHPMGVPSVAGIHGALYGALAL